MSTNRPAYMKAYYESHKEKIQAQQRAYYQRRKAQKVTNPRLFDLREDYKTPTKEEFKSIPTRVSSYNKEYYEKNKEKIRIQQRESRLKKRAAEKRKVYYEANRERILEQQRKYQHKKAREKKLSKTFLGRMKLKFEKIFG